MFHRSKFWHMIQCKFLTRMQLCEGSTFIEFPNGMKLFHLLKYSKSLASTQIQFISLNYVSTWAILVFCPIFQFVKQVHFILLHYGWKYSQVFSYPYNLPTQNCGSFHLSIFLEEFSQVSGQRGCLWNRYHFGKSIWYESFTASWYVQIIRHCQVLA